MVSPSQPARSIPLRGENGQKRAPVDDDDVTVLRDGQKIVVAGDQVVSTAQRGAPEQVVVIGVSTEPGRWLMREKDRLASEEFEELLAVGRSDPILLRDLGARQHLGHLVDLPGNQKEQERTAAPSVD